MARPAPDAWIIEQDEYHPDARVAAKYADQNARHANRLHMKSRIAKLEAQGMLNAHESNELSRCRTYLAETEQKIKDFDYNENPED